jgi:uncharacterized protein
MDEDLSLINEMISYDAGDPMRIQHFLKVYEFARIIAAGEKLDDASSHLLHTAAIVHDIGIHASEKKYGSSNGKYQEIEGPGEARAMLTKLGYTDTVIERVCYLVGHHHTYTCIDGADYQILVEADFLVNLYEDFPEASKRHEAVSAAYKNIFKTETGKKLCKEIYGN